MSKMKYVASSKAFRVIIGINKAYEVLYNYLNLGFYEGFYKFDELNACVKRLGIKCKERPGISPFYPSNISGEESIGTFC